MKENSIHLPRLIHREQHERMSVHDLNKSEDVLLVSVHSLCVSKHGLLALLELHTCVYSYIFYMQSISYEKPMAGFFEDVLTHKK